MPLLARMMIHKQKMKITNHPIDVEIDKEIPMSTSENFLNADEISELIQDIPHDTSIIYGQENQEFGVSPYINFYIHHRDDEVEDIAHKIIDIYEEFENDIIDKPFKRRFCDPSETWKDAKKWHPSRQQLIDEMHQSYKEYFIYYISATSGDSPSQSARWAFESSVRELETRYTVVKMNFGDAWYRENKE